MSTIIGVIVAFVFFEGTARWLVLLGFLLFDALEIYIWLRWRKRRALTGAEGIVGATGEALTNCTPEGHVRVRGQTWKARAPEGVDAGESITVVRAEGLQLQVERRRAS